MTGKLRVALVGGPMYDSLYEPFLDEVEVVVHADHPTLNRTVADLLAAGERIDVLSTHGKYAPSQSRWLRPLEDLVPADVVAAHAPRAVELCSYEGHLLCLPRNVDVRILWWRTDRMAAAPATWSDLLASGASFGFTGRESGLFGLYFELVVGAGGDLLHDDGTAAVDTIVKLAAAAPADLAEWHYDGVDTALLDGRVECAAAWPGGYGPIRDSGLAGVLAPAPYPAGPSSWVSYSGCHGWAIPTTCGDLDGAVDLVTRLGGVALHEREAAAGGIPARTDVLAAVTPTDDIDAARLEVTRRTIAEAMITYPHHDRFPVLEDAGWQALNAAIRGELTPPEAAARIRAATAEVFGR